MNSPWFNNLIIYCDNLSFYYIFSVILSFLAVFLTWWFHHTDGIYYDAEIMKKEQCEPQSSETGLVTKLKMARQEAIVQQLSAGLTEQQLQHEKETEQAQLAAIFRLLQQQEEKFQVGSMEELESQLKLYRR